MWSQFIKDHCKSNAKFIQDGKKSFGYGQVEPNHLSAQRTGQIYAQLPADPGIEQLENGQFVKYDYADGICTYDTTNNENAKGEWMLVYNEIKLYREHQMDCEFAMLKDDYQARVYSPMDGTDVNWDKQTRYYAGKDSEGGTSFSDDTWKDINGESMNGRDYDKVTKNGDYYEPSYNDDPYHIVSDYKAAMMPKGTTMVPRVFKTNVGDIFTTNMLGDDSYDVGDILAPKAGTSAKDGFGILTKDEVSEDGMKWQVVKVYTMPDHQPGVKLMRIA